MSQPETTIAPEVMSLEQLLDWMKQAVDRFIVAAQAARSALDAEMVKLGEDEGFKALYARQPGIVDAILKAEMERMAKAMEAA